MVRLLHFCCELHKKCFLLTTLIDDLFNEKHQNMELKTLISYFFALEYVIFKTIKVLCNFGQLKILIYKKNSILVHCTIPKVP